MRLEDSIIENVFLVLDNIDTHLWLMYDAESYGYVNQVHTKFIGKEKEEVISKKIWNLLDYDTAKVCYQNNLKVIKEKRIIETKEWAINSKGKKCLLYVTKIPILNKNNQVKYILCKAVDITEVYERDERTRIDIEQYKAIVENQSNLVCKFLPDTTLTYVNKAYCGYFNENFDELVGKKFISFIPTEEQERILNFLKCFNKENSSITYEHKVIGSDGRINWQRWTDTAFFDADGNIVEFQSIGIDITDLKMKEELLEINYNKIQHEIKEKEELLEKTKDDLINEINQRKIIAQELNKSVHQLRKSINSIIDLILKIIELRDPYTNNHQARVAYLAYHIGKELNLSHSQLSCIYISAILHDVGKIYIPPDILSKPGKLNNIEYSFVKMHSEIGYNLLKGIDFHWPVSDIVLQHHERIDGSGYPKGLKGNQICLEAKIIAVADVVEAMSSHRPYRPALGIENALQEIEKNKGKYYDSKVVDACVKLFNDKKFSFSDERINIAELIY